MGKLFQKWLNTPTRGELRAAQLDGLRWQQAADKAWIEHMAKAEYHQCAECWRSGFKAALIWYRENKE